MTPRAACATGGRPATAAKYKVKADRLAAQFDQYEPIPGVHIKGKLTLGENLADLGGHRDGLCRLSPLRLAPRRAAGDRRLHRRPALLHRLCAGVAGQGARRRAARSNCSATRTARSKYRVDGIVRNFDPWYKAFNVQPGDKLYLPPEQRVHVW